MIVRSGTGGVQTVTGVTAADGMVAVTVRTAGGSEVRR